MHRDNGFHIMGRQPRIERLRVEAAVGVAVYEVRRGAAVGDGVGGGYKCERRNNNIIARANTKYSKGEVEGGSPR